MIQDIAQNTFCNDWNPFLKIETIFKKCVADYLELNIKIETINFANAILRKGVFFINQESQDNRKNFIDETCTSLMSRSLFDQAQSHVRLLQNLRNKSIPFAGSKIIMTTIYEQYWSSENHNYYVVTDINQNMLCLFSTTMIPIHLIRYVSILMNYLHYIKTFSFVLETSPIRSIYNYVMKNYFAGDDLYGKK